MGKGGDRNHVIREQESKAMGRGAFQGPRRERAEQRRGGTRGRRWGGGAWCKSCEQWLDKREVRKEERYQAKEREPFSKPGPEPQKD